jgi:hypothetical protein
MHMEQITGPGLTGRPEGFARGAYFKTTFKSASCANTIEYLNYAYELAPCADLVSVYCLNLLFAQQADLKHLLSFEGTADDLAVFK